MDLEATKPTSKRIWLFRLLGVGLAVAITFAASLGLDRLAGRLLERRSIAAGLVFPPHHAVTYRATDFVFTATTNALGFRDREFSVQKGPATCRVAAIGDSFTFGWGVSVEESWPKLLERDLRRDGFDAEVADLGLPGAGPIEYANVADRAIPALEPDLTLVALLQGDDLAQCSTSADRPRPEGLRHHIIRALSALHPNLHVLVGVAEGALVHQTVRLSAGDTWQGQAREAIASFTPEERVRYEQRDPEIRSAFEAGTLNPALVVSGIRHPDYFLRTFPTDDPTVRGWVDEMSHHLERIRRVASGHHGDTIALGVPFGLYVSRQMYDTWQNRYGFTLDRRMLEEDGMDLVLERAAQEADIAFSPVTREFRSEQERQLFFRLDGHLNADGNRLYEQLVKPIVESELERLPRCHAVARASRSSSARVRRTSN